MARIAPSGLGLLGRHPHKPSTQGLTVPAGRVYGRRTMRYLVLAVVLSGCVVQAGAPDALSEYRRAALQPTPIALSGDVVVDGAGVVRRMYLEFDGGGALRLGLVPVDGSTDLVLTTADAEGLWSTERFAARLDIEVEGACLLVDLYAEAPALDVSLLFC